MAQWVKPTLVMSPFHIRVSVLVLAALLLTQLCTNIPGKATGNGTNPLALAVHMGNQHVFLDPDLGLA